MAERPTITPTLPYREAWLVRSEPGCHWSPVLVQARPVDHMRPTKGAWPPRVYGPIALDDYGELLTTFLARNPRAEWRRIPWPESEGSCSICGHGRGCCHG